MSVTKCKREMKVVEVSGSNYEMGLQYGAACPEIKKILEITYEVFGGRGKVNELAREYIPRYLASAEAYAPEIVDEIRGMAEGAGLKFEDIFFLNITYELSVPSIMGCTSFAISGELTGDGKPIAGQNFDYLSMWEDSMVLLKMRPGSGPDVMAVAPAGCLGLFGLNSAGVSVNLNLLRNRDSLSPAGGVPTHIILRKALNCDTIGEAIGRIASAEGRSAKNYLLASGQGDIVDIETTSDDVDVHYAEEGVITHANHFLTPRFRSTDLAPAFWPDSYVRCRRLLQLLKGQPGPISADAMKELLEDHNNHPNSVCRHQDPKNPLPAGRLMKTLISIISCPGQGKAYIALGNPCENEYLEYSL